MCKMIAVAVIAVLLSGCFSDKPAAPATNEVWGTAPELTFGIWESEKLAIQPWYGGRCEFTSENAWAETELGYYMGMDGLLYYADKENPELWVPVCGRANCAHAYGKNCDAQMPLSRFVVKDGRIYYEDFSGKYGSDSTKGFGLSLYSKELNGSNIRFEYTVGEAATGGGYATNILSSKEWIVYNSGLNVDGSTTQQLIAVDETGEIPLFELQSEEVPETGVGQLNVYGDKWYFCYNLLPGKVFRIEKGEMVTAIFPEIPGRGCYLSGNVLRVFRPNDGYYDIDLTTGKEVKLCDAQLENSEGIILLPNCVVESNLLKSTQEPRPAGEMQIFDGESWRTVTLPGELLEPQPDTFVTVEAISSDTIILKCRNGAVAPGFWGAVLYAISLDSQDLKAGYYGTIVTD